MQPSGIAQYGQSWINVHFLFTRATAMRNAMSNLIQLINHPNNIVEVRLNRPDKRNAMSFALLRELLKVGEELHEQRSVRAVILTGEGSII
jgi:enoyl-CoA hydratase/carnithine racemase